MKTNDKKKSIEEEQKYDPEFDNPDNWDDDDDVAESVKDYKEGRYKTIKSKKDLEEWLDDVYDND